MPSPIEFHFDYISPYAYIAWTQIHKLAEQYHREVKPVPTLFAGLLNAAGTKGPAEVPAKRTYVFKDTVRIAHALGIPLFPPKSHPFNPLLALRISSLPMEESMRKKIIDAFFHSVWGGTGLGVHDVHDIRTTLTDLKLDAEDLIKQASTEENKNKLKHQTESAIAKGAFGVPTIFVDGELFFGYDSFQHIARKLEGIDPITNELIAKWESVPSSATRTIR